ncbi:DUF4357 domain-containing protein [Homoserinimonas sp. A447]
MSIGKQVRLYLVDGTPGGLVTAEIMNWTGHAISSPRSEIGELLRRPEAHRTGIYILLGDAPDARGGLAVYLGEGDEIATRLRQHARAEDQGGKDFWDRVVIFTSKDANLTKAHARYLESRFIALAAAAGRSHLINGTAPSAIQLPEADISDMEYFISQAEIVLPVLGVTVLRSARKPLQQPMGEDARDVHQSPLFKLEVPRHGVVATAREVDGEFTVMQGSGAREAWIGTHRHPGYEQLHRTFVADGTLELVSDGLAQFTRDVPFASPSAAGAVVTGRACNGRTAWMGVETGQTFGEWQSRGVADLQPVPGEGATAEKATAAAP